MNMYAGDTIKLRETPKSCLLLSCRINDNGNRETCWYGKKVNNTGQSATKIPISKWE